MSKKSLKIEFFHDFEQQQKKQDQEMLQLSMADRIRLAVKLIKKIYGQPKLGQNTIRRIQIIS